MPSAPRFDRKLARKLVAFLRQGTFPHVAAEAAGVPLATFRSWCRRGKGKKARPPFRGFARDVNQAIAQARLCKEIELGKKDPKSWLMHGPGRETATAPGWTAAAKAGTYREPEQTGLTIQDLEQVLQNQVDLTPEKQEALSQALLAAGRARSDTSHHRKRQAAAVKKHT